MGFDLKIEGEDTANIPIEEVNIPVPWGFIAGKWWGSKLIRPIVCLHGWQDNAGTFDTLIPLLPKEFSYLAIDFPGHGRSSHYPDGLSYYTVDFIHSVNLILKYYKWKKITLMAHSMGSVIGFCYNAVYPDRCDLMIGFDTLKPIILPIKLLPEIFRSTTEKMMIIHEWNKNKSEPPSYTYDELIEKLVDGTSVSITKLAAPYILRRSIMPSNNDENKYYFSRDVRLRNIKMPLFDEQDCLEMTRRIRNKPYLFIKASQGGFTETEQVYLNILNAMKENDKFENYTVDGFHHVHLTDPIRLAGIISEFLNKYKSLVISKL